MTEQLTALLDRLDALEKECQRTAAKLEVNVMAAWPTLSRALQEKGAETERVCHCSCGANERACEVYERTHRTIDERLKGFWTLVYVGKGAPMIGAYADALEESHSYRVFR